MAEKAILDKIEALAGAVVMADSHDAKAVEAISAQLEEVGAWARDTGAADLADIVSAARENISQALAAGGDYGPALGLAGQVVSGLQSVVRDSKPAPEVVFPAEVRAVKDAEQPPASPSSPGAVSLPCNVDEKIFSEFLTRQGGVLDDMEALVLALEKSADDTKLKELRRLVHTLKGEGALLGLSDVERLCHAAEDLLGPRPDGPKIDALLGVADWLRKTFDAYGGKGQSPGPVSSPLGRVVEAATIQPVAPAPTPAPAAAAVTPPMEAPAQPPAAAPQVIAVDADPALLADFIQESREHLDNADLHILTLETEPENEEAINAVFRAFHTIKGVAGFLGLDQVRTLAHEAESLLDMARKGSLRLEGAAVDVTFDAVDGLRKLVSRLSESMAAGLAPTPDESTAGLVHRIQDVAAGRVSEAAPPPLVAPGKRVGEILIETGKVKAEVVAEALKKQEMAPDKKFRLGEQLVQEGAVAARDVAQALRAQKQDPGARPAAVKVKEAVKVDADRLDRLLDTIGELVIAESMVCQSPELKGLASSELLRTLSQLDKITRELQEMATSLRMVPIRSTFQKMARLVRDLAKKQGKDVEFVMSGEDTELDKSVVDRIGDPLVHMVRNAVDHGIEDSMEDRRKAGKRPTARVELRAYHKAGSIHIEVRDDGKGLNKEAILAKARERGMLRDGEALTERETFNLIFEAGFSTAKKVTDVSGRGVGMDVVKRNIETLRGQVDIMSEQGRGSVFTIRLPLTLAIIDGMVVRSGPEIYIIPTLSIVRSIRPEMRDVSTALTRAEMLMVQGRLIPLFRLDRLFQISQSPQELAEKLVVVVDDDGKQAGIVIDELMGEQQIVIKSLGRALENTPGVSGGAIMPDGHVGLILDVGGLVRLAHRCEEQQTQSQAEPALTPTPEPAAAT